MIYILVSSIALPSTAFDFSLKTIIACCYLPSSQAFGSGGLAYSTGALTIITLFFGELLPKALGVSNPEMVRMNLLLVSHCVPTM